MSSRPSLDPASALLARYRPLEGVPDEFVQAGDIRPVWRQFANYFGRLTPEEIEQRIHRGDQYLRDAGVFYRQYEAHGSVERDWRLSHIPVLIDDGEWRDISRGLVQRAELLETVLADLYGSNRLVADGHLPAELVASNPEWLRPMVGVAPRSGHFLHFIALEIGRGPGGEWWVLGDRTQAPSGAAFALENRVATSRVFADLFPAANVHRLAGFFRDFRDALFVLRNGGGSRVGVLTLGPLNDTYYEHAYLARYLGFSLLRGKDLAISEGRVMVRTVAGLQPIDVLWRRIDASFIDPLVFAERSELGTPGLADAIRDQAVAMVNMPGSGILETRVLMAFLPRICQELFKESLIIPNIATWWCGQPYERDCVLSKLDSMMVGPALSTRLPFDMDEMTVLGGKSATSAIASPRAWIEQEGAQLVGQEAVTLSTTPAYVDGQLVPRPMIIRVFLARTPAGWRVMPGGYARIGQSADPTAIAMQRGGSVADVWVIGDRPIAPTTMRPPATAAYRREQPAVLPSRAAENLFWLGRYSERAESIVRLARAYHLRLAESSNPEAPLLRHLKAYLEGIDVAIEEAIPEALLRSLGSAMGCAGEVRDRFSIDGWAAITDLEKTTRRFSQTVRPGDDAARAMGVLLRKVAGFSGLVHKNMYRFTGWRFLTIGRSVEYAAATASMLRDFADRAAPDGALDLAVEVADSVMSHRRRFAVETDRTTVVDLLALDASNPRSVLNHLTEIRTHAGYLPGALDAGAMSPLSRAILQAHTALAVQTPDTLDGRALGETRANVWRISDLISETYFQ